MITQLSTALGQIHPAATELMLTSGVQVSTSASQMGVFTQAADSVFKIKKTYNKKAA